MFGDEYLVESIGFDKERHCIIPNAIGAYRAPISLRQKTAQFVALCKQPMSFDRISNEMELLTHPVRVPRANLKGIKAAPTSDEVIVMAPTFGHTQTAYNMIDAEDRVIMFTNQMLAVGWEMVRQTLTKLGAKVVVAEDIYDRIGVTPLYAKDGIIQPVQQIFTRDSGVAINGKYYTPSEEIWYEIMSDVAGKMGQDTTTNRSADRKAQLIAGLRPYFAQNIVEAFQSAGKQLTLRTIDAFFEGGDVIVDHRRGCIFVGNDEPSNAQYSGLQKNAAALPNVLKRETGMDVVVITRPFSLRGKGRGDGERFHLDALMNLLPQGELLIDPQYVDSQSLDILTHHYGSKMIHIGADNPKTVTGPLGMSDVPNYTANLTSVGDVLLMPDCSATLKAALRDKGYDVISAADFNAPPGYFYLRSGSIHCVTQSIPSPA